MSLTAFLLCEYEQQIEHPYLKLLLQPLFNWKFVGIKHLKNFCQERQRENKSFYVYVVSWATVDEERGESFGRKLKNHKISNNFQFSHFYLAFEGCFDLVQNKQISLRWFVRKIWLFKMNFAKMLNFFFNFLCLKCNKSAKKVNSLYHAEVSVRYQKRLTILTCGN